MMNRIILLPLIVPLIAAVAVLCLPKRYRFSKELITIYAAALNLLVAFFIFNKIFSYAAPWLGFGLEFRLRLDHFSAFAVLATAAFGFLVSLYSVVFMREKPYLNQFYSYLLLTIAFVNGAVLSDNLVLMLFFWEGLLLTLFGMIAIGNKNAFKTATKAFIIVGIADLCLMAGIALTGHLAHTLTISKINLPIDPLGGVAFVLLMIGAICKSGSMPFHSWIPDAAVDAPLPFMSLLPAAIEKIVGIYFVARFSLEMFKLTPSSWVSTMLMTIGALTIVLAVAMALIQKDYKRLLSYHAISQVGYMILGIGTAVPVGIVGGLFHMINNAMYKSCLFMTGGAVEKQAGTTNLEKLGGLGRKMPVTFICFIIAALSISGVPPFNGFFSKELVYDGALERGLIFYLAAIIGSFLTAASFLKLGHSAFLGPLSEENKNVKETSFLMLVPMILIAGGCILFGVRNSIPLRVFIQPILGSHRLEGHDFTGMPGNIKLIVITVVVLVAAFLNHLFGVKSKGSGLKAADHIRYAPVLSDVYNKAEKRFFDPYEIGLKAVGLIAGISWAIDRGIDWVYDRLIVSVTEFFTAQIKKVHNGNYSTYLAWSLVGMVFVVLFLMK